MSAKRRTEAQAWRRHAKRLATTPFSQRDAAMSTSATSLGVDLETWQRMYNRIERHLGPREAHGFDRNSKEDYQAGVLAALFLALEAEDEASERVS